MRKQSEPFVHYSINNFLSAQVHEKLLGIYDHLKFLEKESDLFHFFQTDELAEEAKVAFFRKELSKQFEKITPLKDTSYSLFASYYFKGNHLLCHDDVVEDRKYAFSYYLQDFNSGELVFYNSSADSAVKKIKVKKNLLVIFQVSNISYHEVALAKQDGRKAVTGWLNQKGWGATRPPKLTLPYQPSLPSADSLIQFDFPQDISSEEHYSFPGVDYEFHPKRLQLKGPFYQRRAWRMQMEHSVVMKLKGYSLLSADFLQFSKGDYMLLNDPVNDLQGQILDVFILRIPKGHIEGNLITIVNQDGSIQGHIPYTTETMFMVHRGQKKYFIDLVLKQIRVAHLIYRKKQKQQKKQPTKANRTVQPQKGNKKTEVREKGEKGKATKSKTASVRAESKPVRVRAESKPVRVSAKKGSGAKRKMIRRGGRLRR